MTVGLDLDGRLDVAYPQIKSNRVNMGQGQWVVTVHPDGTLVDDKGRSYPSLFWEGVTELIAAETGVVVDRAELQGFVAVEWGGAEAN